MPADAPSLSLEDVARFAAEPLERVRAWQAAGLLGDPATDSFEPADVETVRLIALLERRGVARETIVARRDELESSATRRARRPREWIGTLAEAAARAGLDPALAERLWTAAGLVASDLLDERDVDFLRDLATVRAAGNPDDAVVEMVRVAGDTVRRATETMARVTYFHVIRPLRMSGLEGTALNDAIDRATRPLTPLASQLLNHLTDRVMNDAIRENVVLRFTGYIAEPGQLDVAIAFVDLCGFTPLAEAMGDRESAEVLGRFSTLVRDAVASHTGRIVKQLGDAFMLAFADPRLAVGCAVEIERRAAAMERFPALRSGIHCGLVLFREGDYVGTNVNIAARVAAEAGRHQVLVTNEVRRAAGTVPGVQFTPVARRKLKGVGEEVELFAAAPTEAAAGERAVDPVCGMELGPAEPAARLALGERTLVFCSTQCLQRYVADPARYAGASS